MAYLLDANVLIQAHRRHYAFDFCPGFWTWIERQHAAARVFSVAAVGRELSAGNDTLADWADQRGGAFFIEPDAPVLASMAGLSQWVMQQRYQPAGIATFLQAADYYLVAAAHAHQHVLVTHELPADTVRHVKIPNACVGMGVRFMTPFEMLRVERARFVLEARA